MGLVTGHDRLVVGILFGGQAEVLTHVPVHQRFLADVVDVALRLLLREAGGRGASAAEGL